MCDAVVRLSHDFRIEDRAPHLMTLLSHRDSDEGLKGVLFQDLMFDDSDKSAFCTHLSDAALSETGIQETASEDGTSIAGTLPSTLKDAGNSRVKVRLFYTTFKAMDNNWRYVVGIREDNLGSKVSSGYQLVVATSLDMEQLSRMQRQMMYLWSCH